MSYDLHAFPLAPGESPEEALDAMEDAEEHPPTEGERATMDQLTEALVEVESDFERFDAGDVIDLSGPAVEVSVYARGASIGVPYRYDGEALRSAFRLVLAYASVLREVGHYAVWDPQREEYIDDQTSIEQLEAAYAPGREHVRGLVDRRRDA